MVYWYRASGSGPDMREENAMKPVYTVGYVSYRPEELISTLRSRLRKLDLIQ